MKITRTHPQNTTKYLDCSPIPSQMMASGMIAVGGTMRAREMIGAKSGIGYVIMQARVLVQTDQMFVGLLTLAVVGLIVDLIFNFAGRALIWRYIDFYEKS